jgi:G3E family GTPase
LHGVVTAVDGIEGARSLAEQRGSRAQAALADALVVTKTASPPAPTWIASPRG